MEEINNRPKNGRNGKQLLNSFAEGEKQLTIHGMDGQLRMIHSFP